MTTPRPHIIEGEFQSDKYPTCPRGKVPLSVRDASAQDLLWEYAQRRRAVDAEFSEDLEFALRRAGYRPKPTDPMMRLDVAHCRRILIDCRHGFEDPRKAYTALDGAANEIERLRAALDEDRELRESLDEQIRFHAGQAEIWRTEAERLRAALVNSDAGMQTLRAQHQRACDRSSKLSTALLDVLDVVIEETTSQQRYCTACGYGWHVDQPATDRVHGEGCVVEKAQKLLQELHR